MLRRLLLTLPLGLLAALSAHAAQGADPTTDPVTPTALAGSDFTFTLARAVPGGTEIAVDETALASAFGAARCACPSGLVAHVGLTDAGAMKLGNRTVNVDLVVGQDCDNATVTCRPVTGGLTLDSGKITTTQSLGTDALFTAANGGTAPTCSQLAATSTRLWAIPRVGSARVPQPPSLGFKIGADAAPAAPTEVTTLVAETGLLVSWKSSTDEASIAGYQVLCAPGRSSPPEPAYDSCTAAPGGAGGSGPFAKLSDALVCSPLIRGTSTRVEGLKNGTSYAVAVVAVRPDGTPSLPSAVAMGTPAPTLSFFDRYRAQGGQAETGCAVAPHARGAGGIVGALAIVIALILRRRRAAAALALLLWLGHPSAAAADDLVSADARESPRHWNFELRFGPYRPDVDTELAAGGGHPFRDTFGGDRRLMTQFEFDRQLLQRGGTLALGFSVGRYRATGAAPTADTGKPSGDETWLQIVPLSAALVYRADFIFRRWDVPFVPFAKLGLDYDLWSVGHSGRSDQPQGSTPGWHAAAGISMYLDFLEPDAARTLDQDFGVNHTALVFEVTRWRLHGLGATNRMHLGDTTWSLGLMLEI